MSQHDTFGRNIKLPSSELNLRLYLFYVTFNQFIFFTLFYGVRVIYVLSFSLIIRSHFDFVNHKIQRLGSVEMAKSVYSTLRRLRSISFSMADLTQHKTAKRNIIKKWPIVCGCMALQIDNFDDIFGDEEEGGDK